LHQRESGWVDSVALGPRKTSTTETWLIGNPHISPQRRVQSTEWSGRSLFPVNSIRVSIREVLDGLATVLGYEACHECSRRNDKYDDPDQEYQRCDGDYLKTITAIITGGETTPGRRITIGHMKAVFVKENMAGHRPEHKGAKDLE
jgi:hypothetical protein